MKLVGILALVLIVSLCIGSNGQPTETPEPDNDIDNDGILNYIDPEPEKPTIGWDLNEIEDNIGELSNVLFKIKKDYCTFYNPTFEEMPKEKRSSMPAYVDFYIK
ncbi:MAG: hypothetical protein U9N35_07710, partial [Euryarchaeota archaeon]|nr:hypothetical protein [Euryarchaeota archaeon]